MWRLFKVHLWGTCTTSLLPLSILTTSMFWGSYLTCFTHCLPNTICRNSTPPLASSSSPCLNHHGIRTVTDTDDQLSHFWRPLYWWPCHGVSRLLPLDFFPIPQPPLHTSHIFLYCLVEQHGQVHTERMPAPPTPQGQFKRTILFEQQQYFSLRGDICCVSDPWMHIKIPEQENVFGLYSTLA